MSANTEPQEHASPPQPPSLDGTKSILDLTAAGADPTAAAITSNENSKALETWAEQQPKRRPSGIPGTGHAGASRPSLNVTMAVAVTPDASSPRMPYEGKTIYDFQVLDCNHELYDLTQHRGRIVLICNVASKDKEYSQKGYRMLNQLYTKYHSHGLDILGFPCNQFGAAEPGNEEDIVENVMCLYSDVGDVEFPIMAKIDVNGDHELPMYTFLKSCVKGTIGQSAVRWNFTSFLVSRDGLPVCLFAPGAPLEEVEPRVVEALNGLVASPPSAPPEQAPTREPSATDIGEATGTLPLKSHSSSPDAAERTADERGSGLPEHEVPLPTGVPKAA